MSGVLEGLDLGHDGKSEERANLRFVERGIEKAYELPPEADTNLFAASHEELAASGIRPLPRTLDEALTAMERSDLVAETLGGHVFEWFLRNKRAEWDEYTRQVTPFELARYLPSL